MLTFVGLTPDDFGLECVIFIILIQMLFNAGDELSIFHGVTPDGNLLPDLLHVVLVVCRLNASWWELTRLYYHIAWANRVHQPLGVEANWNLAHVSDSIRSLLILLFQRVSLDELSSLTSRC